MQDTAAQSEQVPDGMKVGDFLDSVEDDPEGIEKTADQQQPERFDGNGIQHGFNGDDNDPAGQNITDNGRLAEFFEVNGIEDNAHDRSTPNNAEQYPA